MKPLILVSFGFLLLCGAFLRSERALGANNGESLLGVEYGAASGLEGTDIRITTIRIINIALGLLGILTTALIIYGGFRWMVAGGEETNIQTAQKIIFSAVLGLIIVLSAYSISRFVLKSTYEATTGEIYRE